MSFSSIKKKTCKCGNPKCLPTLGYNGYNFKCAEKAGTKTQLADKKKNARLTAVRKLKKDFHNEEINKKILWYKARRYEMTGVCHESGCTNFTNKDNNKYFTWSVCHVVPKALVGSVAYHPANFIELCWEHHAEFDSNFDKAASMGIFKEAKRKFEQFKHLIPPEELRKINPYLTDEVTQTTLHNLPQSKAK